MFLKQIILTLNLNTICIIIFKLFNFLQGCQKTLNAGKTFNLKNKYLEF